MFIHIIGNIMTLKMNGNNFKRNFSQQNFDNIKINTR